MLKLTTIIAFFAIVAISFSQTPEEIFEKSIEARGGKDKIESIETWTLKGNFVNPNMGQKIPFTFQSKLPKLMKLEYTVMGNTMISMFDGEKAWMKNPFAGMAELTEVPENQLAEVRGINDLIRSTMTLDEGETAEYNGLVEEDGKQLHKVSVTTADGQLAVVYFDSITNLLHKTIVEADMNGDGSTNQMVTTIEERTKVNGVIIPKVVINKLDGNVVSSIEVDSAKANEAIEDSVFKVN